MKARARIVLTQLLALLLAMAFLLAPENNATAQDGPAFTQQELDQMLAPIALYPDALLSQIMMAATYPLEVIEAERWSAANPGLGGDRAVRAVERNNWDPSVKSLVAFPQILRMMSDKLDWTERLGDAFLGQEQQVMDTVQDLRQRAYAAGNLRSNDWYRVQSQGRYITVEQANPEIVYVPYYNPTVVYGPWWWAAYPPVYWAPWPGYRERPGFGAGFAWGVGITLGAEFFFGAFDWPQRHVNVVNVNNYYYPRNAGVANRAANTWQHDPGHRRGTPYRAVLVREKFSGASASPAARRDFRGHEPAASEPRGGTGPRPDARASRPAESVSPQPAAVAPVTRPDARDSRASRPEEHVSPQPAAVAPVTRPDTLDSRASRPEERVSPQPAVVAPATRPDARDRRASRPIVEQRPHALEGVGRGTDERNSSARGRASVQALPDNSVQAARLPASVAAPRPPERVAAPPPSQHVAAPRSPERVAEPRAPEKARDNKGKAPDAK